MTTINLATLLSISFATASTSIPVRLRASSNAVIIAPGDRYWEIFTTLVKQSRVIGNLVSA